MPKCKGATGGGAAVPVSLFGLTGIDSGDKPRFSIAVGIRTARRLANGYRFRSTRAVYCLKCVTFQTLRRPCAGDGDSNLTRGLFSHLGTDVRLRGHQNNSLISNVNCPKRKST